VRDPLAVQSASCSSPVPKRDGLHGDARRSRPRRGRASNTCPRHRWRASVVHKYRSVEVIFPEFHTRFAPRLKARFARADLQLIGRLHRVAPGAREPPAQPRLHHVDADRLVRYSTPQSADRD